MSVYLNIYVCVRALVARTTCLFFLSFVCFCCALSASTDFTINYIDNIEILIIRIADSRIA